MLNFIVQKKKHKEVRNLIKGQRDPKKTRPQGFSNSASYIWRHILCLWYYNYSAGKLNLQSYKLFLHTEEDFANNCAILITTSLKMF